MRNVALFLAGVAVVVLAISQNILPLVALVLSFTFGIYGVLKSRLVWGLLIVTTEVFLLLPIALTFLLYWHFSGIGSFGNSLKTSLQFLVDYDCDPLDALSLQHGVSK